MTTRKVEIKYPRHMANGSMFCDLNNCLPKDTKKELLAGFIKRKLKDARIRSNVFAANVNKKPSEITKWLSGRHNFTIETLFEIEEKLGITIINLGEMPKPVANNVKKIEMEVSEVKLNLPQCLPQANMQIEKMISKRIVVASSRIL